MHLWNKRTRQRGRVLTVLLDSGAGGGNYASAKLIHEIERADYGGRNMISKKGKGRLRAANPENSKEPPMSILGTCFIFAVFPPVDKIFAVKVRVVDQLPLGLILGTAFMGRYESSLIFEGPGAGWFKPTPTSPRAQLLPWLERPRERGRETHAVQKTAAEKDDQEDKLAWVTSLSKKEWIFSEDEDQGHEYRTFWRWKPWS